MINVVELARVNFVIQLSRRRISKFGVRKMGNLLERIFWNLATAIPTEGFLVFLGSS